MGTPAPPPLPPHFAAPLAAHRRPPPLPLARAQDGSLPIHYAARYKASAEVVALLHELNPDGVKTADNVTAAAASAP